MRVNTVGLSLFVVVAALVGADLLADAGRGSGALHLGAETLATAIALVGAGWFTHRYRTERAEAAAWRARAEELLAGPGGRITQQLEAWNLTPAEAEVALLLLKGLAFGEIAAVRETGERTAREQAGAVYRKAGVAGRAELAAWFLEDLL